VKNMFSLAFSKRIYAPLNRSFISRVHFTFLASSTKASQLDNRINGFRGTISMQENVHPTSHNGPEGRR